MTKTDLPDCTTCGACCREAFDSVPVDANDPARTAVPEMLRHHDDGYVDLERVPSPAGCGSRCVALRGDGSTDAPFLCAIYANRPTNCRELERGSEGCLEARRRVGLAPWPPDVTPDGPWARAGR